MWHQQLCYEDLQAVWFMQRVRHRLIQDRREEVEGVAKTIYSDRQGQGQGQGQTDGFADWVEAENRVIRSTFERQTGCTLSLTASMMVSHPLSCMLHSIQSSQPVCLYTDYLLDIGVSSVLDLCADQVLCLGSLHLHHVSGGAQKEEGISPPPIPAHSIIKHLQIVSMV